MSRDIGEQPSYFSIMTADVRYATHISDFAKILYSDITSLCNKNGFCTASNDYFASVFEKTKRTISATISALAENGYITVEITKDDNGGTAGRRIRVMPMVTAAAAQVSTPIEENFHRGRKNLPDPMEENFHHNNTSINNITPIVPTGDDGLFDEFWTAYPKHVAKAQARKAFGKLKADRTLLDQMLAALNWQREQPGWKKDNGSYVPNPSTWLNARRWEDEPNGAPTPAPERKPRKWLK